MKDDTYVILKIIGWLLTRDRRRHATMEPGLGRVSEVRKPRIKGMLTPSELLRYVGWVIIAGLSLAGAAVLAEWGEWYFTWVVGTAMIILLAAFAGALYDHQARGEDEDEEDREH